MVDLDSLTDAVVGDLIRAKTEGIHPADTRIYDKQRDFIYAVEHMTAFIAGVGSGKSYSGAYKALHLARPNTAGMITAPSYNMLRDTVVPTFRIVAGSYITSMTRSPPIDATLRNGARIMFRSAHDPELLRGPSISWWWGDEAALYSPAVFPIMIARLREGGNLGYGFITTTPKGRNWIWQTWVKSPRKNYKIFRAATQDNPFLSPEYYEELQLAYSGEFARQELDGDFVTFEGIIYSEFDRLIHMQPTNPDKQWSQVIAGVDWGYANPGVIVVYGIDGDGNMHGLHEEYQRRRQIGEWAETAKHLKAQYHINTFYCDPAEPEFIAHFRQAGLNAVQADNAVLNGIQAVKARLSAGRLTFDPSFVNTAAEMEQYIWAENAVKDKPIKANDHTLDATRYAVQGANKPRVTRVYSENPFYD